MDNAGGGKRGLRAEPTQDLFYTLYNHYGINVSGKFVDLGGSSNLNLLVYHAGKSYVIRVYRPYVTENRLADIQRVRYELSNHGINCSKSISTFDGQPWVNFGNRLLEVEHYVESNAKMDTWEHIQSGLSILAKIHQILEGLNVSTEAKFPIFANYIESDKVIDKTRRGIERMRAWNLSQAEQKLTDKAERLADFVYWAEKDLTSYIPKQLVHGDFWDNNVFFQDGNLVLVADFDFMGERARIDDLALTLYFTCLKFAEYPLSNNYIRMLSDLVDAYDSGLDNPLTSLERAALPLAIVRQPLWSIGGWVALLDDDRTARNHALSSECKIEWALQLVNDIDRWKMAFL